jgi:hypothetical protein
MSEKPQSHSMRMYLVFAGAAFALGAATVLGHWMLG